MAKKIKGLPKNAYTELKAGEKYKPIIPADKPVLEITRRSVLWGLFMAVLFSAAAAFLGLKIGTVFEAAIPIAILAIGLSSMYRKRRNTILENVIIQSIGATSGAVVAGAIFTLPAIFILGLDEKIGIDILKLFLIALFGGFLGILFLVPFRRYFVADMHGKFPFPEATATTEILVTGEKGGKQAKTLLLAAIFASVMDFLIYTFHTWSEIITTRMFAFGTTLADKAKMVFKVDILASITGLGYIIGIRYSAIIVAGSFVSWFVLVPLVAHFGEMGALSAEQIFVDYVRNIGIGAIAMAGIMGIIKSSKVIINAFTSGLKEMIEKRKTGASTKKEVRTDKDIKMSNIIIFSLILAVVIFLFFRFSILAPLGEAWKLSLVALLVVIVISFLFTSVAARAIAIVGMNPVSGMTLMTLILSSVILVAFGLSGDYGMLAALLIGGVVCTALSNAGAFITDLKIGYWIGATPWNQERFKFLGTLVSAFTVTLVIILLNNAYGFVKTAEHDNPFAAPQANAMAAVLKTLMSTEAIPWILFGVGILFALILEMTQIPTLAFALGMYLPQELTVPLVIGGSISYFLVKSSKDEKLGRARKDKGTLIASGFIAGGAIMGVIAAIIKNIGLEKTLSLGWDQKPFAEPVAVAAFTLVLGYLIFVSRRAEKE